jgi:hypothetical protein
LCIWQKSRQRGILLKIPPSPVPHCHYHRISQRSFIAAIKKNLNNKREKWESQVIGTVGKTILWLKFKNFPS